VCGEEGIGNDNGGSGGGMKDKEKRREG